jgi:diguanylate cyclase (GGDEF)-like protein/PAS domain S-box-containing protein
MAWQAILMTHDPSDASTLSEARLRGILESATDAILTVDGTQTVLMANRAASEMFGCPIDVMIGAPLARFIPERFRAIHSRDVDAFGAEPVNARKMGRRTDVLGLRSDGQEFPIEGAISHLTVGGQRLFTAILRDVSERRHAELMLRQSEARYRRLLMLLPDAVIVSSAERITFVNDAAQHLLGAHGSALVGRDTLGIFHPDSVAGVESRLRTLRAGASSTPLAEEQVVCADGAVRVVETTSTPIDFHGETSILHVMRDVSELAQARSDLGRAKRREEQLSRWAFVDSLTALANRRSFEQRIEDALARGRRSDRPVILLLIDLDRFKEVNDSLGHAAGDTVLWEVARRLEQCARTTDFVARLGGDEFVIVLEGARSVEDAELVARTVQSKMKVPFSLGAGILSQITTSIGIAVSDIGDDSSALLGKADQALYQAKNGGRDTFAVSGWQDDLG